MTSPERRGKLSPVLGHAGVLQTGFVNLLSNGLKFVAPGGSPRITIWEEAFPERVRIWVADNGIATQNYQKIFNSFHRLHAVKDYPGNGVVLATVSKALQRVGGTVGVESKPGKGSRFWLDIPRLPGRNYENAIVGRR